MDYPTPDGRYCRCGTGFWVYPDSNPHQTECDDCLQKKRDEGYTKDAKILELSDEVAKLKAVIEATKEKN